MQSSNEVFNFQESGQNGSLSQKLSDDVLDTMMQTHNEKGEKKADNPIAEPNSDTKSAANAGKGLEEIMGEFELTPAIAKDGAEPAKEKPESMKATKEVAEKSKPPLTRLEAHVLRTLARALSDGDATAVEEQLGILADHPASTRRVLEELKRIKEASDDEKSLKVSWEQGTDRNNERFVRLYMSRPVSKSSHVEVVIGSDGRNQAVRHNEANGQVENISLQSGMEAVRPVEALRQLSVKQELLRQATERRRPQP